MPSEENSVSLDIKSFVSNDKFKLDEDALSLNQIPETISSGSSINIMVSSSSSCGNVGSISSSSLGNQEDMKNNLLKNQAGVGSELSSSSRRSSISGDMETKITKETKSSKSLRKPKRSSASKSRKMRRIAKKKREMHNNDADDDESDNVFDESENDSALEKDISEKNPKFNCLDLDLFDYLLQRNFLKSLDQNKSDIKILNSTAKQRKLSLFTASSDFTDFETNLNINKYFYELIKNGKKLEKIKIKDNNNVETPDCQIRGLMNEMVSQVEKNLAPKQSLIKTLLQDMSSLNSITPNDMKQTLTGLDGNNGKIDSVCQVNANLNEENKSTNKLETKIEEILVDLNKENELMEKTSLNTTEPNSCVNEKETLKENMNKDKGKLTNGELISDPVTQTNGNVKKVILKNNEVVLIEDCLDDENEEEDRLKLLKLSNKNAQSLISDSVPKRHKTDPMSETLPPTLTKSQTFSPIKQTKANQEDDPYVKAALERFDAFCKSKSSHNLDQAGSFALSRQKSPYLTRKLSSGSAQVEPDPAVKESVSSFIKRRSVRVDPAKTDLTTRSASESRADSTKSFSSSSLAKKFLGSLTPQLEPSESATEHSLQLNNSKTNSTCTSPSISETNSPPSSPSHQSKSKMIKLEVLNSKSRAVKQTESKPSATNKPPIPPSPTAPSTRTKTAPKPTDTSNEKPTKPVQNQSSAKPVSRIIPIEIKNSKNSAKIQQSQRTAAKSVERVNTSQFEQTKNENQLNSSVQDRIRSLSTSYRENLNEKHDICVDRVSPRQDLTTSRVSPRQSDNIYQSVIRQSSLTEDKPDPIVEKACNNFMNRLKEFQRLHSSQTQSYTSATSGYSGPIVSARNTNPSLAEFGTASAYKPLYSSAYSSPLMSSSYYEPSGYSRASSESDSAPPSQPYVSAIRKRRTLFSDGFDSASTELKIDDQGEFGYERSESEYSQYSARSESDEIKQAQIKNRPLSIVSEESNTHLNRSNTINDSRTKEFQDKFKCLKKSNSITGSSCVKSEAKIRSSVFDRLSMNATGAANESKTYAKSSSSLVSKPPSHYEIKKKEENEIAVVNSVVPKTRRESTSSIGGTASAASSGLNRIRSLDPKNRDKFKTTSNFKQQSTKPATNFGSTSTHVPACYLYPCGDVKQTAVLKSASNTSNKFNEENKRKTQNGTIKNGAESKKDVFERLSKRANSMKNLSSKSKNSSSCSSSGEENDHRTLVDENYESGYQCSQNSGSNKTSVFERLYKSNIAAQMSQDEAKSSSLKKNMSVSSANLISNGQLTHNSVKKSNLNRNKGFINTRISLKNRKDDSANDESNESKTSDCEIIKNESPRDASKSSVLCKKLMDLYDK